MRIENACPKIKKVLYNQIHKAQHEPWLIGYQKPGKQKVETKKSIINGAFDAWFIFLL